MYTKIHNNDDFLEMKISCFLLTMFIYLSYLYLLEICFYAQICMYTCTCTHTLYILYMYMYLTTVHIHVHVHVYQTHLLFLLFSFYSLLLDFLLISIITYTCHNNNYSVVHIHVDQNYNNYM